MNKDSTSTNGLFAPGATTQVGPYVRRVWDLRHFVMATAKGRLNARNQGMVLGSLWLLLEPLLFIAVYYLIFKVVIDASRGVENFILFLAVGRLTFSAHRTAVMIGGQSLAESPKLVQETVIPKAVLPLGAVASALYQWRLDLLVILATALVTKQWPMLSWLWVLPITIGLFVLSMGMALLLAPLVANFTDLKRALPVMFRLVFYATGVMFPVESYVEDLDNPNLWYGVLMLNPVYGYVKAMQWAVLGYEIGRPMAAIMVSIAWTIVLFAAGIKVIVHQERRLGSFRFKVGS